MSKNTLKRALALMLALIMIVGALPVNVFAAEGSPLVVTADGQEYDVTVTKTNESWIYYYAAIPANAEKLVLEFSEFTPTIEGSGKLTESDYTINGNTFEISVSTLNNLLTTGKNKNGVVMQNTDNNLAMIRLSGTPGAFVYVELLPAEEPESEKPANYISVRVDEETSDLEQIASGTYGSLIYFLSIPENENVVITGAQSEAYGDALYSAYARGWTLDLVTKDANGEITVEYSNIIANYYNDNRKAEYVEQYNLPMQSADSKLARIVVSTTEDRREEYEIYVEILPATVAVESIALDKTEATIEEGKTVTLTATVLPENATDKTVTWTSSDPTVATVENGVVTALKSGRAAITATAGEMSAGALVTVINQKMIVKVGEETKTLSLFREDNDQSFFISIPEGSDITVSSVYGTAVSSGTGGIIENGECTFTSESLLENCVEDSKKDKMIERFSIPVTDSANKLVKVSGAVGTSGETDYDGYILYIELLPESEKPANYISVRVDEETSDLEQIASGTYGSLIYFLSIPENENVVITGAQSEAYGDALYSAYARGWTLDLVTKDANGEITVEYSNIIANYYNDNRKAEYVEQYNLPMQSADSKLARIVVSTTEDRREEYEIYVEILPAPTVDVTGVTVDPATATLEVGGTTTLTATVAPADATNTNVTWTSSDPTVATVENGVVTALKAGEATITAKAGEQTATCAVTVKAKSVFTVAVGGEALELTQLKKDANSGTKGFYYTRINEGDDIKLSHTKGLQLNTMFYFEQSTVKVPGTANEDGSISVTWAKLANGVLKDRLGMAMSWFAEDEKALFENTENKIISIQIKDADNFVYFLVFEVIPAPTVDVTGVTLDKTAVTLTEGKTETLTATVAPENATDKAVTWASDNEKVATVKDGVVTAVKAGTAKITATASNGVKAECVVTVEAKVPGKETLIPLTKDNQTSDSESIRPDKYANISGLKIEGVKIAGWSQWQQGGNYQSQSITVYVDPGDKNGTATLSLELKDPSQGASGPLVDNPATADVKLTDGAGSYTASRITIGTGGLAPKLNLTITFKPMEIVVPEGHYKVTVKAPVGTDLEFFNGTDGKEAFTGTVVDDGTVENYHQYTIVAAEGLYSYRGKEGTQDLGGMAFKVPVDDEYASDGTLMGKGQVITLKRVNYYPNHKDFNKVGQYAVTVVPKDLPEAVMGSQYVNDGGFVVTPFLANAAGNVITYQVAVDILEKDLINKYGIDMLVNVTYGGSAVQESAFTVREISYYTVTAPKGAKVQGFNQLNNFNVRELDVHHTEELEDGMIKYYFAIGGNNATYRVSMDGKITRAGYFSKEGLYGGNKAQDVVITFNENENPQSTKTTASRIENSSILNVNPQNNLTLAVGEEFRLRSYRAGWQIINTDTANIMIEPDFHYNIISGAEHIKMTPADNQCTGNAGTGENTNWMDITAVSEGTVVLEISYDAIIIGGTTSYPGQFGAVDPSRKSVVVIEVGENEENTLEITSTHGTHSKWAWDADLSTVYMFGDKTDFSFTAKINDSQPDKVEFSNDLGKNWTVLTADEGIYTAKDVLPGNNLLKVTKGDNVEYQVVRASKASIIVVNMTHPGDTIIAGDTIRVMFSGIYSPTPKMSGIYNPGFTSPNRTQYTNTDEGVTYSATSTQYGFAADNMMTIKFTEAGTFRFTDGYIPSAVMGNKSGQHRVLTDAGCGTNMNARDGSSNRCVLPDLEFEVIGMPVVDVKITTNPTGAEITIDGQTPEDDGTYKLEYGTYNYTAKLEGYVPAKGKFTVGGDDRLTGKKDVIIDLKKIEGAIWDGTTKTEPKKDENGVYLIGTGAEFAWYATSGAGQDAKLTADISLGGFGISVSSLTGTFDGCGHYVTDFYHNNSLFAYLTAGAVVKNLGVEGIVTTSQFLAGSIANGGYSPQGFTVENCVSRVDITSTGWAAAGIVGGASGFSAASTPKIINCYNAGTVTGNTGSHDGGIGSTSEGNPQLYIVNCYNIGNVSDYGISRSGRGTIRNNYYLLGSAQSTTNAVGTAYTADVLKTIASDLGEAYMDNPTSYNDGYPILAWEAPRALEAAKAEFPAQLENYKDVNNYLEEQQAELAQAIEAGKKAIAEAETLSDAVKALEDAKAVMDAVKTAEDIADENAAILARAKSEAKTAITSYKNAEDYRDEQKEELSEAIAEARKAIEAAVTVEEVSAALAAAKAVIDAIPTDAELSKDEKTVSAYLSISHDTDYVVGEGSGEVMALRKLEIPYFDLSLYGLEKYYFVSESYEEGEGLGQATDYEGKVTILHMLLYATEVYHLGIDPEDAGKGYLYEEGLVGTEIFSPEGSAGSMYIRKLWGMDENFNYYYNYKYPLASEGWGSTADQILLKDGDIVTVGHFTSWNFHLDDESVFNFLRHGDAQIKTSALKGETIELTTYLAAKGGNYTTAHLPKADRAVYYTPIDSIDGKIVSWNYAGSSDENGNVLFDTTDLEAGQYLIATPGRYGVNYTTEICSTPGAIILTVEDTVHTHTFGEWNVIEEAKCDAYGQKERYCADCKAHESEMIDMIAHKEEEIPAVEATCEETGLTAGKKCSVCGTVTVKQTEVAKKAHTPVITGAIEATCEKGGYTGDTVCEICGHKIATGQVTEAKGHTFGEWTVVKAATCTEEGSEKRACDCGKEETRKVVKLAHKEEIIPAVEPTGTSTGLTEGKKCSVCGEVLVAQETIEKLVSGDADGDGSVSAKDATQILRYINGKTSAFDQGGEALEIISDVNKDGVVDAKDATQILRHINGKASVLDAE